MGAKHSFRSPDRGGVSLLYALHIAKGLSFFQHSTRSKGCRNRAKVAKVRFYLLALVFSRENRRPKTAKAKICFTFGASVVLLSSSFVVAVVVPTGCRWSGCRGFRWSAVCVPSLCSCLCPLCCFVCGALLANMPLFRVLRAFLAGFVGFVWVCVGLVLCVACEAFVCVSG